MELGQREHQESITKSRPSWWSPEHAAMSRVEKVYICYVSSSHNCDIFSQGFDKSRQGSKKLNCQTDLRLEWCRLDAMKV